MSIIVSGGKINYYVGYSCESDSMYPTFDCNDLGIYNSVINKSNLIIGEVYRYQCPGDMCDNSKGLNFVHHRLINVTEQNFTYWKSIKSGTENTVTWDMKKQFSEKSLCVFKGDNNKYEEYIDCNLVTAIQIRLIKDKYDRKKYSNLNY